MNFRRLTLIFFILLPGLTVAGIAGCNDYFSCLHMPLFYLALILVYLGISVSFAFFPCTGFHHPVVCRGKKTGNPVAITFDDGPDPQNTPLILDILKRNGVAATFFCIGSRIEGNEPVVKALREQGHLVGNHSWSHSPWFDFFLPGFITKELRKTNRKIKEVTGAEPLLFRPPFGVVNPMLSHALHKTGLTAICWSVRSLDTLARNPEKVTRRILDRLHPGAIILLHDHTAYTRENLEDLIREARRKGYDFIPLDELLEIKAYA